MPDRVQKILTTIALVVLPAISGALLGNYLALSWALLAGLCFGIFAALIYLFFARHFEHLSKHLHEIEKQVVQVEENTRRESRDKLTWRDFWSHVNTLLNKIDGDQFKPDIVLSIGRSGSVVGGMLATNLKTKHVGLDRVHIVYDDPDGPNQRKVIIDESLKPNIEELRSKKILCVMSECDTGHTLKAIFEYMEKATGTKIRSAVLFTKRNVVFEPTYWSEKTDSDWPELPFRTRRWESHFPTLEVPITENRKALE